MQERENGSAVRQVGPLQALADLRSYLNEHRRAQVEYLAARTEMRRELCEKQFRVIEREMHSVQERYRSLASGANERNGADEIGDALSQYLSAGNDAMEIARAAHRRGGSRKRTKSPKLAADLLEGPVASDLNKAFAVLKSATALNLRLTESTSRANAEQYSATRQWAEFAFGFSVVLSMGMAAFVGRFVSKPIRQEIAFARRIVAGDFTEESDSVHRTDEAGELAGHLNEIQTRVQEIVEQSKGYARRITLACDPISSQGLPQAEGVRQRHEQSLQMSIILQQMASAAKEISGRSVSVAETARRTTQTAAKGEAAIEGLLSQLLAIASAVNEISDRLQGLGNASEQIGKMTLVIDDIAGQTNLLALNAAIESARAGEQGRGFAVVAGEVTKLAKRTTKATREIGLTIGKIQLETQSAVLAMKKETDLTQRAVESTRQAAELLLTVVTAAQSLEGMASEIAATAAAQVGQHEQITANLAEFSKLAEESAEGAAQISVATSELGIISADLQSLESRIWPRESEARGEAKSHHLESRILQERRQIRDAKKNDRQIRATANALALADRLGPRPGVAKIHARLLSPEEVPEPQRRDLSTLSSGTRG